MFDTTLGKRNLQSQQETQQKLMVLVNKWVDKTKRVALERKF